VFVDGREELTVPERDGSTTSETFETTRLTAQRHTAEEMTLKSMYVNETVSQLPYYVIANLISMFIFHILAH
jgi:hypothetical protein